MDRLEIKSEKSKSLLITYTNNLVKQVYLIVPRLERLAPDSVFAHQASGCRRELLRLAKKLENMLNSNSTIITSFNVLELERDSKALEESLNRGFLLIVMAAKSKIRGI